MLGEVCFRAYARDVVRGIQKNFKNRFLPLRVTGAVTKGTILITEKGRGQ